MDKLLLKKLGVGALIGFLASFLPALLPIIDQMDELVSGEVDYSILLALLIGAIGAGLGAATRFLIAYLTNFLPTDTMTGPGSRPDAVVVSKAGKVTATEPPAALPDGSPPEPEGRGS